MGADFAANLAGERLIWACCLVGSKSLQGGLGSQSSAEPLGFCRTLLQEAFYTICPETITEIIRFQISEM